MRVPPMRVWENPLLHGVREAVGIGERLVRHHRGFVHALPMQMRHVGTVLSGTRPIHGPGGPTHSWF